MLTLLFTTVCKNVTNIYKAVTIIYDISKSTQENLDIDLPKKKALIA
jgi:hypothetical protein